jgi:hypothetical protein
VGADETFSPAMRVGVYGTNVPLYTTNLGERLRPARWPEQGLHPPTSASTFLRLRDFYLGSPMVGLLCLRYCVLSMTS